MRQVSGTVAETAAAAFLAAQGFVIVGRNWRTKICEIDIIARRGTRLYFVEVKYRLYSYQGEGSEYITAEKLWRMRRAAQFWVLRHNWQGEYCLSVAAVAGKAYRVTFIESIVE